MDKEEILRRIDEYFDGLTPEELLEKLRECGLVEDLVTII